MTSSLRQLPTQRSATPFCQGLSNEVRTAFIFRDRMAAGTSVPYFASRSWIRNLGAVANGNASRAGEQGTRCLTFAGSNSRSSSSSTRLLSVKELVTYLRGWLVYFGDCQTPSVLQTLETLSREFDLSER